MRTQRSVLTSATSLRIPTQMLQRADRLVEELQGDPLWASRGEVTRSDVLRIALLKGIESLEGSLKRRA